MVCFAYIVQTVELKVEMVGIHEKRLRKCLSKLKGKAKTTTELPIIGRIDLRIILGSHLVYWIIMMNIVNEIGQGWRKWRLMQTARRWRWAATFTGTRYWKRLEEVVWKLIFGQLKTSFLMHMPPLMAPSDSLPTTPSSRKLISFLIPHFATPFLSFFLSSFLFMGLGYKIAN